MKWKRIIFYVSRTTLCTPETNFCMQNLKKNCSLEWKNCFATGKKNFLGQFRYYLEEFLLSPSKKMPVIEFPHLEIIWLAFFFDKKCFLFYLWWYTKFNAKQEKTLWKFDDLVLAKCMKLVWLIIFHRLCLWNCMISIFCLWRSNRAIEFRISCKGSQRKQILLVLSLCFEKNWNFWWRVFEFKQKNITFNSL